jgi:hypothetical protein
MNLFRAVIISAAFVAIGLLWWESAARKIADGKGNGYFLKEPGRNGKKIFSHPTIIRSF